MVTHIDLSSRPSAPHAHQPSVASVPQGVAAIPSVIVSVNPPPSPSCFSKIKAIPRAVADFIYHRYADFRLFIRALFSLRSSARTLTIENRIHRLDRFRVALEGLDTGISRDSLRNQYAALPVKNLLFYIDPARINRLLSTSGEEHNHMKAEMIRDCTAAATLQKCLIPFSACLGLHKTTTAYTSALPVTSEADPYIGEATSVAAAPERFHIREVPGTVPYRRGQIPADVQQRANQIIALKAQWDQRFPDPNASPEIHEEMKDYMEHFMEIPVFDASHPAIVNALQNQNIEALKNLSLRHTVDHAQMEQRLRDWRANCATCRNPIDRDSLRIDVTLQQRILDHLKTAIATRPTRAEIDPLPAAEQIRRLRDFIPDTAVVPDGYECPISHEIMAQPMREIGGGHHVFDRISAVQHIQAKIDFVNPINPWDPNRPAIQCPMMCPAWDIPVTDNPQWNLHNQGAHRGTFRDLSRALAPDAALQTQIAEWLKQTVYA